MEMEIDEDDYDFQDQDYINIDRHTSTCGILTENEILNMVSKFSRTFIKIVHIMPF